MSVEELLKPRYKVIAAYPNCHRKVGHVLESHTETLMGVLLYDLYSENRTGEDLSKYPHLFKKLEWYEDREESEMPEYLKHGFGGHPRKVKQYLPLINAVEFEGGRTRIMNNGWFPCTKEEYESYIKLKK